MCLKAVAALEGIETRAGCVAGVPHPASQTRSYPGPWHRCLRRIGPWAGEKTVYRARGRAGGHTGCAGQSPSAACRVSARRQRHECEHGSASWQDQALAPLPSCATLRKNGRTANALMCTQPLQGVQETSRASSLGGCGLRERTCTVYQGVSLFCCFLRDSRLACISSNISSTNSMRCVIVNMVSTVFFSV